MSEEVPDQLEQQQNQQEQPLKLDPNSTKNLVEATVAARKKIDTDTMLRLINKFNTLTDKQVDEVIKANLQLFGDLQDDLLEYGHQFPDDLRASLQRISRRIADNIGKHTMVNLLKTQEIRGTIPVAQKEKPKS